MAFKNLTLNCSNQIENLLSEILIEVHVVSNVFDPKIYDNTPFRVED